MNLYLISTKDLRQKTTKFFKKACSEMSIGFIHIDSSDRDLSKIPIPLNGDIIYQSTSKHNSKNIFHSLVSRNTKTIFLSYELSLVTCRNNSVIYNYKDNLNIIPTVLFPDWSNLKNLEKNVIDLGGYPVISKIMSGQNGVGVKKIDSLDELKVFQKNVLPGKTYPILRKFIPHSKQARIIVVGDEVVTAYSNVVNKKIGYKSNTEKEGRIRILENFNKNILDSAIAAVKSIGYSFGGVDILFDERDDKFYIAEVNSPCNFVPGQELSGVNIALKLVKHLMNK